MTLRTHRLRTAARVLDDFRALWCEYTHGGGKIERDPLDRINWRCCRCGRWSTPVPLEDESAMTDAAVALRQGDADA